MIPVVSVLSCAKNLDDYNLDEKNPNEVPAEALYSNAVKELSDAITTPSVNINITRFFTQQLAATTYQDEPNYDLVTRNIPENFWTPLYQETLKDLDEAVRVSEEDPDVTEEIKGNRRAVADIMAVYTWSVLVNTFGNIPYTEALDLNHLRPVYDDAETIYMDLFDRLDAAIALINTDQGAFGADADRIYEDDMEAWIKFAHSLRMRLAITIADVNEEKAREVIQDAMDQAFTSNADNAAFPYLSATPNNNPVSNNMHPDFTSRADYVAAEAIVDQMNEWNDPRRPFYFTQVNGEYKGGQYGVNNTYANFSHVSEMAIAPEFEALLMDYSEVEFILAEAAARGLIGGSAADHYHAAITASITYWGGLEEDVIAYLAQPPVNYLTAEGDYRQKIGIQKWIALYNRGCEAWLEWRRLDYPELTPGPNAVSGIPLRMTYPIVEDDVNHANKEAAAEAIGGDAVDTRLFWDVN